MQSRNKEYTLEELAELVGGTVTGDKTVAVRRLNGLELAQPGDISFITDAAKLDKIETCSATALIVPRNADTAGVEIPLLQVQDANLAAAIIHTHLLSEPFQAEGIHSTAVIGDACSISEQISIGARVAIGDRVIIGDRVRIAPGTVIGDDVQIGADTVLHANVSVQRGSIVGQRVIIHPGAVIGSDGFGFATDYSTGRHVKKPQVGIVTIGDDVEIGANTCVDRAAFGKTVIRNGVMIDNLVQVAHNVDVGENSILVSQVGIAGSASLGRNVVLGGQVGVAGHLHLGDGVMAAAQSGIHNNQKNGTVIGGSPAIDIKRFSRASAAFSRLPEMRSDIKRLKKELKELTAVLQREHKTKE